MSTIGISIRDQCIGRLIWSLRSMLCQKTPFEDEFDLIKAKRRGVNEQLHFRIQIENLDEDVIQMLRIQIKIVFAAEPRNNIQKNCAIAFWIRIQCYLVVGDWDSDLDLDYSVIMQPNLGWGIIANFRTIPYIASTETTICLCFAKCALLDRRTTLDNLVGGIKSENSGILIPDISSGGAELVKSRVGVMRSLGGRWKHAFSRAKISERVRMVPILTGQIGRIRCFSWPTKNGMIHFRWGPFTQRSMSSRQKTKSVRFIECS